MKPHKTAHPHVCTFVPPYILEFMAKSSTEVVRESVRESARLSMMQDDQIRATRAAQAPDISALSGMQQGIMAPPAGTAGREVFNCSHQWGQPPPYMMMRGEGDPLTPDDDVNCAYDTGGAVRDYYKNKLGRNSIDNLGMNQLHNVHFGQGYMNAFWDGSQMTYGDGDGMVFTSFTRAPDVIAHELTHGVTQYTAGLVYFGQSGALNESMSDVFGTVIQQAIDGASAHDADWLIGNEIMGPELYGEALRSMKAPGTAYDNPIMGKDPQPDHMSHYYYGAGDNQGVHINSGIPNKVFYLVAMDIGTDKAALIWYATLQRLWPNALFGDFAYMVADSARLLTKNKQVPVGTTQTVRAALREVGL
jgi:Zn-dependent metalloprotease